MAKEKKKNGRPTKFKPEFISTMLNFFGGEPYEIKEIITEGTGKNPWKKIEYKIFPNKLPTLVNFARSIDVSYHTVLDWVKPGNEKKYPNFLDTFNACKARQKDFLMQNGLNAAYNAAFAKFTAINITDMRDEVTVHTPESTDNVKIKGDIAKMSLEAVEQALNIKLLNNKVKKAKK